MTTQKNNKNHLPPIMFLVLGLIVGILLKLFVFDILVVEGTSMEPAITEGNKICAFKLAYGIVKPFGDELLIQWAEPKVGDIILYFYNNRAVIKRCVAVAGMSLDFSDDSEYTLFVGENKISLSESQYQRIKYSSYVPEGMILAIGDNYSESIDSRDYGFVSTKNILAKVMGL
ncbi:MAG: signal peptidase I [Spirochaetaceae bacterium]|nr:signal peptidase I [Spirochaetaceae bacterium]